MIKKISKNCVIFLKVWHKDPYEQINKDDNFNNDHFLLLSAIITFKIKSSLFSVV